MVSPPTISVFITLRLRLCCLVWPHYWSPFLSYTPGCWYYKTEKLSLQPQLHMHRIALERENTNIDSFFKSWDWLSRVALQSKAWVCGHSLAGIVGSNPPRDMNVCLLWVLCAVRGFCNGPLPHFRGVLPSVFARMREIRCKTDSTPAVCN